jgi:hypothetical protein
MADNERAFDREKTAAAMETLVQRIKLRQWCVEQAKGDSVVARKLFEFCCEDIFAVFSGLTGDDA